jgi:hypothetical protein
MKNQFHDMTHSVEFLSEDLLDAFVLEAFGLQLGLDESVGEGRVKDQTVALVGNPAHSPFLRSFTREWELGGRLIETFRIGLKWESTQWVATYKNTDSFGATPLIAAMRVLVRYACENKQAFYQFDEGISVKDFACRIFGGRFVM